ncbi:hypothetical protein NC651_023629 [Populus alba x Populus x berolinensis]|nr:hypothetical protein NC651_023629 [Populus alba x Populus x berolinensis]
MFNDSLKWLYQQKSIQPDLLTRSLATCSLDLPVTSYFIHFSVNFQHQTKLPHIFTEELWLCGRKSFFSDSLSCSAKQSYCITPVHVVESQT